MRPWPWRELSSNPCWLGIQGHPATYPRHHPGHQGTTGPQPGRRPPPPAPPLPGLNPPDWPMGWEAFASHFIRGGDDPGGDGPGKLADSQGRGYRLQDFWKVGPGVKAQQLSNHGKTIVPAAAPTTNVGTCPVSVGEMETIITYARWALMAGFPIQGNRVRSMVHQDVEPPAPRSVADSGRVQPLTGHGRPLSQPPVFRQVPGCLRRAKRHYLVQA